MGLSHAGLLRNLLNAALLRHHRLLEVEREAEAAAHPTGEAASSSSSQAAADGGEEEEEDRWAVQLGPLVPLDVYSGAPMFPVAPDSWDLLLGLREQREGEELREMEEMYELEGEVQEVSGAEG